MSYQVEISRSDVQKLALTITIIPCLLFAAGFLTATLSQSNPGTLATAAQSNNDAIAPPANTAPTPSVVSEIAEPSAAATEQANPATSAVEPIEPVVAEITEAAAIAEPIGPDAAETIDPVTALEEEPPVQESSKATEEEPKSLLATEDISAQPLRSDTAHQKRQLFSVQVAAFREASNAIDYAVELKAKGYPAEVTVENSASDTSVYKVLYGTFERDKALKSAADFSQREKTTSFIIARS